MKSKISYLFLSLFTLFVLASCSSDDTESSVNLGDETAQIPVKEVLDNLIIKNATKKEGAPSTPNEAINFELVKDNKSAIQSEGFNIKFSGSDIKGLYLQIKNKEGEVADGYYDILLSNNTSPKTTNKAKKGFFNKTSIPGPVVQQEIDVDFKPAIEPGTFCYVVCVYDAEGNISAPQEVCVTVESWGGNDSLVGSWNFTKEIETYKGETKTIPAGEKDCYEGSFTCNSSGESISYNECVTTNSININFKSDGSVTYEVKSIDDKFDYDKSQKSCKADVEEINYTNLYKGNWAYSADSKKMILVVYEDTETVNGVTETTKYDEGDADIFELEVSFDGGNLILSEDYGTDGLYKYYFEKK